ncbi:TadE/TadG family type IV pilus assembly protein [Kitasatospora sp. NPDC052896]|uniref:TadE/TadG family type IV pilus assembly protein n=1 Tax=Kitasatospora sp. NPDC052896 TaxID=3364061 RepID=UPI0037CBDC3C
MTVRGATTARPSGGPDPQRGSLAIEAAILVPAILVLFCLVIVIGRLQVVGGTVDEAARTAARSATLDRSTRSAQEVASESAAEVLRARGVVCPDLAVSATPEQLPVGDTTLNAVNVTVTCQVRVSDLFPLWVPGSETMTGSFTSVIDRYRSQ